VNLAEALGGTPRIRIGFYFRNVHVEAPDFSRIVVLVPVMVYETAEKALALLAEHGAVEKTGIFVAPVASCEAIASSLTKAGFSVIVDPCCVAAGRTAKAASDRASQAERN
jgi:hypothetical protein